MVAYSFKPRFVDPIQIGLGRIVRNSFGVAKTGILPKRQTIRADRRRHARPGEEMQLYCELRTKNCFLIGRARCVDICSISINFDYRYQPDWPPGRIETGPLALMRVCQGQENLDRFARMDGFDGWEAMREFWRDAHGLDKFVGVLIRWEPLA